ncbi:diacylglycerol/lipid kinase family protein [Marinilactibacillus kalidii]|uniref:diacylglycerol/lipid kinase family protein n=1 Tax=Marinilactibacillus kalidii TaxID=2820274 RepID=UPI001ABEA3B5|nr:diacylglycerol kinase family protein [Marinilactibacillus kalidii]
MNPVNKLIFILNEHSRNGRTALNDIKRYCLKNTVDYHIHLTEYSEHATALAKLAGDALLENERLVVVGGDGTLNEVVNALEKHHIRVPIGYIPTGSGNDFARSHKWMIGIEAILDEILSLGASKQLDIIKVKHEDGYFYAVNSFGAGIDGMVNYQLSKSKLKRLTGHAAYFISIIAAYFKQRTFSLNIESAETDKSYSNLLLVACVNHKFFGGGIPIHPTADPTDSLLEIVLAEKVTFLELLTLLFKVLTKQNHLSHKKMHAFRLPNAQLTFYSTQHGQKDGELLDIHGDYAISTIKRNFWMP